jgi:hypothetical protein
LFDIGVYTFFQPRRVAIYVLRITRFLADHDIAYLRLKKTNTTKNRKRLMQESNSHKIDSPVANCGLTRLRRALPLAYLLNFCLLPSHRPIP